MSRHSDNGKLYPLVVFVIIIIFIIIIIITIIIIIILIDIDGCSLQKLVSLLS